MDETIARDVREEDMGGNVILSNKAESLDGVQQRLGDEVVVEVNGQSAAPSP